jgi:hypothetical protein
MRWAALFFLLLASACGGAADDTSNQQSGYGTPTLEVTVNGAHSGPAAPDSVSYVDLVNQYDQFGSLTRSTLTVVASSTAAMASCQLSADRYGEFVTSFGVGQWSLSGAGSGGTDDGTAEAIGAPTVATSAGNFACTGSNCAAVTISLSYIDASHAEGFMSGTMSGADVVCSFYLPTRTFSP